MKYLLSSIFVVFMLCQPAQSENHFDLKVAPGQKIRIKIDTVITKHILLFIPYHITAKTDIIGSFSYASADTIALFTDEKKSELRRIALNDIKRFDINAGKKRTTLNGALIGAGLATWLFIIVAVPGDVATDSSGHPDFTSKNRELQHNFPKTLISGALMGGFLGWFRRVDKWREINRDNLLSNIKFDYINGRIGLSTVIHF